MSPWDLLGYIQLSWENWWRKWLSGYSSYFWSYDNPLKFQWLKRGNITTIFKKGKRKDLEYYRLVSLTSCLVRSLIKCSWRLCWSTLENKEVIGDSQHDFTKGKSCWTNLVAFWVWAIVSMDKGRVGGSYHLPGLRKSFWSCPTWHSHL